MTCPESYIRPLKPGSPIPRASLLSVGVQLLFAEEMGDWGRSMWPEREEQREGRRGLLEGAPLPKQEAQGCSSLQTLAVTQMTPHWLASSL